MALKQGAKGDEVTALQESLGKLGFGIEADGIFGPATKAAVEELQMAFGYDVDGIVGKGTTGLIEAQIGHGWNVDSGVKTALQAQGKQTDKGSLAGVDLKRTLKEGASGGDVAYLQRRLNTLGYTVPVTGSFDGATSDAVHALQKAFGYTVDGIVGKGTHTLINAQIGHGWKAE
jgi:peptidoglycan hydrolase-like protein with peptidoglycan-binding domain